MVSIDELSIKYYYYDGSIITNALEDIRYGSQIPPYINARDARFKMPNRIRQTKINGKEQKSQQRVWEKVYIKSLRML